MHTLSVKSKDSRVREDASWEVLYAYSSITKGIIEGHLSSSFNILISKSFKQNFKGTTNIFPLHQLKTRLSKYM